MTELAAKYIWEKAHTHKKSAASDYADMETEACWLTHTHTLGGKKVVKRLSKVLRKGNSFAYMNV